jgi:hypothetical protein
MKGIAEMSGSQNIRFSDLFADTVNTHGLRFARKHYVIKHGMQEWEFQFWLTSCFGDALIPA